jgi:hypothetical protein
MEEVKPTKPKAERVQEAVHLLQQLNGVGISNQTVGYGELKGHIDLWIQENIGWTGTILFPRFLRKAHVILPTLPGRVATIKLSVVS